MALTFTAHVGDGTTKTFPFAFKGPDNGYFRDDDVIVEVNGVDVPFKLTGPTQVTLVDAPANQAKIQIKRVMPKDAPYTDFVRGNNFGQTNVNRSFLQQLYALHETMDGFKQDDYYEKQPLKLGGYQITDLGVPLNGTNAASAAWVTEQLRVLALSTGAGLIFSSRQEIILSKGQLVVNLGFQAPVSSLNFTVAYNYVSQNKNNYVTCDATGTPVATPTDFILLPEPALSDGDVLSITMFGVKEVISKETILNKGQEVFKLPVAIDANLKNYQVYYNNVIQNPDQFTPTDENGTTVLEGLTEYLRISPPGALQDGDIVRVEVYNN